jgi:hypothetical protein
VEWATDDIIHTNDGPWVLSRVCHLWREIALAHPELWSIIKVEAPDPGEMDDMYLGDSGSKEEFDIDSTDADCGGRSCHLLFSLNLALERSRDHPLEVSLDFGLSDYESDSENGMAAQMRRLGLRDSSTTTLHAQLVRAVVAHSARWKTADLQITSSLINSFASIHNRLPLLTKLTLNIFSPDDCPRPFL